MRLKGLFNRMSVESMDIWPNKPSDIVWPLVKNGSHNNIKYSLKPNINESHPDGKILRLLHTSLGSGI